MTVTALKTGTNVDKFCYETKLNFGDVVTREILTEVLANKDYFERRFNYNSGKDPIQLTRMIGAVKTRELLRRQRQVLEKFPGQSPIEFKQYFLNTHYEHELYTVLPGFLKEIAPGEPKGILQISEGGTMLPVHKGHNRKCSLMMLLQANQQETRWYQNTEDFAVIDPMRIPDLDKIEPVASVVMKPFTWYMFNHADWHSVHGFGSGNARISIGVDYYNIEAEQLVQELKQHGF
tara:strand:- start:2047 stop:2748 length:702 start_codon:yes stop_codon:yes gene_type:complete